MSDGEFKVVDKRRFTEDGGDADAANVSGPQEQKPREKAEDKHKQSLPPVDFTWFVVSLATQAMVLVGDIPDPQTKQLVVNLEAAKQTIDILGILQEKTKGNLTEDEERLLEDALANIRLAYVRKVREPHRH